MDWSLDGKRAWVGGSSAGIGLATARALADLGASVILVSRSAERLGRALATLPDRDRHTTTAVDLSDGASVDAAVAAQLEDGPIEIVINNTGGPPEGLPLENSAEEYETAFREHVGSAQRLVRACLPGMIEAGYGRVVNITSVSVKAPFPILSISNTVRAGLANWAKTLSIDIAKHGITVNNILPGLTATDRLAELFESWAAGRGVSVPEFEKLMIETVPARRLGTAEDIASAAAFLCTPAAAYVNGVNLPVDGGRLPTL